MKRKLDGWRAIGDFIGVHWRTAQRYAETRNLPVHRIPGPGAKPRVFAYVSELESWLPPEERPVRPENTVLAEEVIRKIGDLAATRDLYRRNYRMNFGLRPSREGVSIRIDCEYELVNGGNKPSPFIQEVTIDDGDHGHMERMWMTHGRSRVYELRHWHKPLRATSYTRYLGPELQIEPTVTGELYRCGASWVINKGESEIWYNHMILPTLGATIEIHAPAEFEATKSYTIPSLILPGIHLDIQWKQRR